MDKENLNGIPEEEKEETVQENTETAEETAENSVAAETEETTEADEETVEAMKETAEETDEEAVICSHCGENIASEGSEYCSVCEKALLKKRIPFTGWLMGVAALLFSVAAFVLAVALLVPSGYVWLGDRYSKSGNMHMAYEAYMDAAQEAENFNANINTLLGTDYRILSTGQGVYEKIISTVEKYYSPIDAYYFIQNFFGADTEKLPFAKKYEAVYNDNYAAFTAMSSIFSSVLEDGAMKPDEAFKKIEALRGTEGIKDIFVDYYKFALAYELGEPVEAQLEILRALEKSAEKSGEDYGWIYYQPLAQALYDSGEYEQAIAYLDKIIAKNASDYASNDLKMRAQLSLGDEEGAGKTVEKFKSVYTNSEVQYYSDLIQVEYLRATGKYDEAKAFCVEAINREEIPQTNAVVNLVFVLENKLLTASEFNRQSALVDMINGDYEAAFTSMMEAYQMESYYAYYMQGASSLNQPSFYNTLYLSAKLMSEKVKMTEETKADVEYVLSMFEAGTMSDGVESIISGETTVEEVLMKGEFDLA